MSGVAVCPIPVGSLLAEYDPQQSSKCPGAYVDCYGVGSPGTVSLACFVEAFYTTRIFKMERIILKWLVDRPSNDDQARAVGLGSIDAFAAWQVEKRTDTELLMCDLRGRTRSWFGVQPRSSDEGSGTMLRFGSVVVPVIEADQLQEADLGWQFRCLLGFHKVYSRLLLSSALKRLPNTAAASSV